MVDGSGTEVGAVADGGELTFFGGGDFGKKRLGEFGKRGASLNITLDQAAAFCSPVIRSSRTVLVRPLMGSMQSAGTVQRKVSFGWTSW